MSTNSLEMKVTNFMAGALPWLAPVPSAALVVNATQNYLKWSEPIAVIAGVVIEGLGLTSVSTALSLWDFNVRKSRNEPTAPFWIAAVLVGVYFVSTIGLTVVLDANSGLTHAAPAIFPILSIVATVNIALRSQHAHRLERIRLADEAARLDALKAEQERKRQEAESKAEQLRREREANEQAERLRLEEKADREARRQERAMRQSMRQSTRQNARHDATGDAPSGSVDRDTFVKFFTSRNYGDVSDLAHAHGFNGELRDYYEQGRRSVSRLAALTGVNPRTAQRWIDAASVASTVAPVDATQGVN